MYAFLKGGHATWAEPHKNHTLTKLSIPGMRNLQIVGQSGVNDSPQMSTIAAALGCLSEVEGKLTGWWLRGPAQLGPGSLTAVMRDQGKDRHMYRKAGSCGL